ncbi:hypothetical protein FHETE_6132 [Fusarium heterosporum]|uniref:Azaphilone pigments biosynthesis cluster protein L N-terminal domain-containing protein n=1 Tax=Fusarium heterosporum TaxID=42747 RepID=A0A8H5WQI5_FUSHE|nr:hypothetical protein FHETE_6132 [Fusarium heterosporum]
MDPVSIIAGIAGIATAAVQISNTLFRLVKTYRNAPTEIRAMAIEMAGLTVTLEHLRDILNTGQSYTRPLFFEGVRHVIKNIQSTQQEIHKMVDDRTILAKFKWLKSKRLLSDMDKHKVTLTLQITILSAAVLVKSTNRSLPISEKCDNRFRIQAESLIQAGQASLQSDNTTRPEIPDPPQERAPSPPFRTTKRFPSPVRQSEIPGHVRTEDLDVQPSAARDRLRVSEGAGDDARSLVSRRCGTPQSPGYDADGNIGLEREEEIDQGPGSGESRRGRSTGFDPLSGKLAQFGRDFHVRGDAATFLYKLVFQDEEPPCAPTTDYQGETTEGDTYGRLRDELGIEKSYPNRSRASTKYVTHEPQEPSRAVNQLLLTWTSLSQDEIEKGTAEPEPDTKENPPKHTAYVESESEDEEVQVSYSPGSYRISEHADSGGQSNSSRSSSVMTIGSDDEGSYFSAASRRRPRQQQYRHFYRRSNPPVLPVKDRTYHPPPSPLPTTNAYPGYTGYSGSPVQPTQYPYPPSYPEPAQHPTPYQTRGEDNEIGSATPKLDVSGRLNMSIVRQDENPISNCDDFTAQRRIPGKAIMGALVGDRSASNLHGLDLANALIEGQSMKLVYIRGSDLGETWFINEQPVFLQFLHCGYLPQFYPAKDSDHAAMNQEYLAIDEEWASFEALNMLGLTVKKREEGRVLLDPNTTWVVPETLSSVSLGSQSITVGERDIDVMNFLAKEEKPIVEVTTDVTQNDSPPSTLQPQISITSPPTPGETNVEFDASRVASTVSSASRFSKLIKWCKSGRKQDHLPLPSGHGSKSNTTIVESEDVRRPLTPSDSGIGSSVC